LDKRIKTKLIADVLTLVGIQLPQASEPDGGHKQDQATALSAACGCLLGKDLPEQLRGREALDLILESHDEDRRSGGLRRIYPAADSANYAQYLID